MAGVVLIGLWAPGLGTWDHMPLLILRAGIHRSASRPLSAHWVRFSHPTAGIISWVILEAILPTPGSQNAPMVYPLHISIYPGIYICHGLFVLLEYSL